MVIVLIITFSRRTANYFNEEAPPPRVLHFTPATTGSAIYLFTPKAALQHGGWKRFHDSAAWVSLHHHNFAECLPLPCNSTWQRKTYLLQFRCCKCGNRNLLSRNSNAFTGQCLLDFSLWQRPRTSKFPLKMSSFPQTAPPPRILLAEACN